MKILVDADACPVTRIVEKLAKKESVECMLLCDTNHELYSDYAKVEVIGAGADAVDYALINRCNKGDVVVTQDYGVAAMALGKGAFAIHQSGKYYTEDNIDEMLMQRHIGKTMRRSSSKCHIKGPKKRSQEDNDRFSMAFSRLLKRAAFLNLLRKSKDDKFQSFHSGLCPGKDNIMGIRVPVLRQIAKEENALCEEKICECMKEAKEKDRQSVIRRVYEEYFTKYEFEYGEEAMLMGYIISLMKAEYETRLYFLEQYVKHIDSWAVCDSPVASMKWIAKEKEAFWEFLEQHYMHSKREYELRFVIVSLLDFYIEDTWIDRVLAYYDQVQEDAYYVKMAVAWGISICFVKYPEKTKEYFKHHNLDEWTFRKALSKITDSYRVSTEDKEFVRSLRG